MFDNLDKGDKNGLECALWTLKTNQTDDAMRGVTPPADGDAGDIISWCEGIVEKAVGNAVDATCETVNGYTSGLVYPPEETNPFEKIRKMINDDMLGDVVETSMKVVELAEEALEMLADLFFIKGKNHSLAERTKRNCHDLIEAHKQWHEEWRKKEQAE